MPANYAHYRFGKQLLSGMCPNDRRSIQRFRRLYDMGLHGPDIFFYYNPLIKTATGQLGGVFHAQSGQEFFARVCAQAGSEAGRVYLLGLLGHYCLDSLCHPYVEKKDADGSARHVELESEFDRYLLEADGVAPAPHLRRQRPHAADPGRVRHGCPLLSPRHPGEHQRLRPQHGPRHPVSGRQEPQARPAPAAPDPQPGH